MMDFCGFFQGKSSEFAWIPEIPYTMHPLKKSPKKVQIQIRTPPPRFDILAPLHTTSPMNSGKSCYRDSFRPTCTRNTWTHKFKSLCLQPRLQGAASRKLAKRSRQTALESSNVNCCRRREWESYTKMAFLFRPCFNRALDTISHNSRSKSHLQGEVAFARSSQFALLVPLGRGSLGQGCEDTHSLIFSRLKELFWTVNIRPR